MSDPAKGMWFRCSRGHVQRDEFFYTVRNNQTDQVVLDTGPLCRECVMKYLSRHFSTQRIPPPDEAPADPAPPQVVHKRRAEKGPPS